MAHGDFAVLLSILTVCLSGAVASASPFEGARTIYLVEQDGTKHDVASIRFDASGDGWTYRIEWRDDRFGEHFLSMRPFRCLEGTDKYWCRIPYPYENRRTVSGGDLADLEYDTMFIWKGATEYGINMWNGVYYKLAVDGDRLVGRIHELDMGKLSAPPESGNLRPVREVDLEPGEVESHWLPTLVVE